MKAKLIAVLLSSLVISLPVHSENSLPKQPQVKQTAAAIEKIDLNKADVSSLIGSFKGIGKKRAEAIIAYRTEHHGFKSIEEFSAIKGFGQHFVDTNREKLQDVFVVN